MSKRAFVFGVDGLTYRILDRLIDQGLLPHFQMVRDRGRAGILKATNPPLTPPSWVSLYTGLLPARHGIFDFREIGKDNQMHPMTHRKAGQAIWNHLSYYGKRSVILNVPLTYPSEVINGVMVSGYMAPRLHTFPASLQKKIETAIPGYQVDLPPGTPSHRIVEETLEMTRRRISLLQMFLDTDWDFFFIVFTGADRIQHIAWDKILTFDPSVVHYYQQLDEALALVISRLSATDTLMIVSDHGFQGVKRTFFLQEYLEKERFVQLKHRGAAWQHSLLRRLRTLLWSMKLRGYPTKVRMAVRRCLPRLAQVTETVGNTVQHIEIDPEKSLAWIPTASGEIAGYADIVLHDSLSDTKVEALMQQLRELRDAEGNVAFTRVAREDVFGSGPFAPQKRHIFVQAAEQTMITSVLGVFSLWQQSQEESSTGIHHPDGVVLLYRPVEIHVPNIPLPSAHVCDIVPTILSCMDLPIPEELDGQSLITSYSTAYDLVGIEKESVVARKLEKLSALQGRKADSSSI